MIFLITQACAPTTTPITTNAAIGNANNVSGDISSNYYRRAQMPPEKSIHDDPTSPFPVHTNQNSVPQQQPLYKQQQPAAPHAANIATNGFNQVSNLEVITNSRPADVMPSKPAVKSVSQQQAPKDEVDHASLRIHSRN